MKCIHCGVEVGYGKKEAKKSYTLAWARINGVCTKEVFCDDCIKFYPWCEATPEEDRNYFLKRGVQDAKSKRGVRKSKRKANRS